MSRVLNVVVVVVVIVVGVVVVVVSGSSHRGLGLVLAAEVPDEETPVRWELLFFCSNCIKLVCHKLHS